ncbi:hypothetical protein [Agrobacterium sp. ST15.13.015]|uniref:hypothetical protein n=1 Tax=Agrobacterium sp. ST15.13.015 TaxID=3017319 RepID=UPI0022BB473B|nr:hypothetical protein [Agrobacterium sp. ST15.13.015]MCZ7500691.1 hypothetical protein [Rhizobium rhizogenes]
MVTPISQVKSTAVGVATKVIPLGVFVWNVVTGRIHGGDGVTVGGIPMAREDQKNDGSFGYLTEIKIDNYAVTSGDNGKILLANKATSISFALDAAVTLGAKFTIAVKNIGVGALSLVPNGSEQIDGLNAPFVVPSGASAVLKCNGSSFRTVLATPGITGEGMDPWALVPLGVPIPADVGMAGFVAPPKNRSYRYILLSAGEAGVGGYNEAVLTAESVSGSSPTISATATVSLVGSPFNGATARLINTTREILRPGSPGVLQAGQISSHTHGVNDPTHGHVLQNPSDNSQVFAYAGNSPGTNGNQIGLGGQGGASPGTAVRNSATGITIQSTGGDENRMRNMGANFYLRIK